MDKPPYRIPSMEEVRAIPWNGYRSASLFAGGGGSSLGYRMAGFQVLYANEFVPAAAETYRANAAPYTVVDTRDIRGISGADILAQIGLEPGELDVLDGSPPCASFSTAGKRSALWGKTKAYSDTQQRTDDLFFEYARLLADIQPRVFVAENVSGLVRGVAKGYFKRILAALRDSGYRVEARLLDASRLGVPQARRRIIFMGVRDDLPGGPIFPKPLPYTYTMGEVLPWLTYQGAGGDFGTQEARIAPTTSPSRTLGASVSTGNNRASAGMVAVAEPEVLIMRQGADHRFTLGQAAPVVTAQGLDGTNMNYTPLVVPSILTGGRSRQADRGLGSPAPTATTAGLSNLRDHQFAVPAAEQMTDPETGDDLQLTNALTRQHPDLTLRKLSIPEVRAISSFPADFILTGSHAQRWERMGRAVPPLMMRAIAETIRDRVLPACAA